MIPSLRNSRGFSTGTGEIYFQKWGNGIKSYISGLLAFSSEGMFSSFDAICLFLKQHFVVQLSLSSLEYFFAESLTELGQGGQVDFIESG